MPRATDSAGFIIGVGTCTDDRTIADSPPLLIGHATGTGSRSKIAACIAGNSTYCSKLFIVTEIYVMIQRRLICLLCFLKLFIPKLRIEIFIRFKSNFILFCKFLGAISY